MAHPTDFSAIDAARVRATAQMLYRVAVVLRNSTTQAEAAVLQTLQMANAQDAASLSACLPRLLRHCAEQMDETDVSAAAIAPHTPLALLLSLPERARQLCVLQLAGLSSAELETVFDWTRAETQRQLEKAERQATLLQLDCSADGAVAKAFADLAMPEETVSAMLCARAEADTDAPAPLKIEVRSSGTVKAVMRGEHAIGATTVRSAPHQMQLPVWVAVTVALLFLGTIVVLGALVWERLADGQGRQSMQSSLDDGRVQTSGSAPDGVVELLETPYMDLFEAKTQALLYAGRTETEATFLKAKLNLNAAPVQYEVVFVDKTGLQYDYRLDAQTGALLHYQTAQSEWTVDTNNFLPLADVRRLALACANLPDAVFTKEKLDDDNDIFYYKMEFYDAAGKTYTVQIQATSGAVLKYEVQEQTVEDTSDFISPDAARQQALARAGGLTAEQVTFTKEKLDGAVYLLCFTLEDGTQYTMELNARTGMANTVDVVTVSADTSRFLGMRVAKSRALEKAGLSETDAVIFTKAKIDRDSAAYVYELEFETHDYEYEVSVQTLTGEIVKYRAWFR